MDQLKLDLNDILGDFNGNSHGSTQTIKKEPNMQSRNQICYGNVTVIYNLTINKQSCKDEHHCTLADITVVSGRLFIIHIVLKGTHTGVIIFYYTQTDVLRYFFIIHY